MNSRAKPHTALNGSRYLRWEPNRFYWGVIGDTGANRMGPRTLKPQQLGYLFEALLPGIPIEDVQTAYVKADDQHFIACGLPRSMLKTGLPPDTVTLHPATLPDHLSVQFGTKASLCNQLNLLTGDFEPSQIQRMRRGVMASILAGAFLCALLIVLGLERRLAHTRSAIAALKDAETKIFDQVLGSDGRGGQPSELRLLAELRALEQTRRPAAQSGSHENCAVILSQFLERWPNEIHAATDSVQVTPTSITVRGRVPAMSDAQSFANSFREMAGWRSTQPQSQVRQDGVDFTFRLERPTGASRMESL